MPGQEDLRARLFANTKDFPPELLGKEADPEGRFGDVEGVPLFTTFASKQECADRGVHRRVRAGIWGTKEDGAYSIVLSGGYEDDSDGGGTITYTGTGGRDESGLQVADQDDKHRDNLALFKSVATGKPVRVIRGPDEHSPWAPREGFRYDGLYVVKQGEVVRGKRGFLVCKFQLERQPGQEPLDRLRRW